ncbi:MAG: hypothetical protein MUF73_07645 [Rhodobacteraceae bacterium]|jgi:hypothetical protein|nr:hypothetical protein [Paracoccaceae bacterium]
MPPIQLILVFAGLLVGVFLLSGVQVEVPGTVSSIGGQSAPRDVTDPAQTVRVDFYGDRVTTPGVAGQGREVYLLSALLADGTPRTSERPATFVPGRAVENCTPRRPAADEALVAVQTFEGGQDTPVWLATDADLARETRYWVEQRALRNAFTGSTPNRPMDPANRIDVIVTDTSAPVYLVLQNGVSGTLWHVVTAPGVRIAHVAAVGPGGLGVSLPDPATPVEFVEACAPRPAREPAPHWDLFHRIGSGPEYEAKAREWFAAYDGWFRAAFGQGVEAVTYGAFAADHVLAGPLPAAPVPWRPFHGATVVQGPSGTAFAGTKAEAERHFSAAQTALATAAAGGSLDMILPSAMERIAALPAPAAGEQP